MPRHALRPHEGKPPQTKLEQERRRRGIRQDQMADKTGMSLATYRRLEKGELANPPLGHVVNCARVLGLEIEEVCEPEWLAWHVYRGDRTERPTPQWWRS